MALNTRLDSTLGSITTNGITGISIEKNANNRGFAPFAVDGLVTVTSSSTFDAAICGVNTLSASTAITGTMPKASDVPGAMMIFRNLSTNAVQLTSSQETAGTKVFTTQASGAAGNGQKCNIPGVVGASVALVSDGVNFLVLSFSGSVTLS